MINVTKPYLPCKKKFMAYVEQIYKTAWLTNHGPLYRELELRLKDYFGVRHVILVSNGTLALQVAYKALDLTGSVITTPFTFVATPNSIAWEGLQPIFADINPDTWNISPKEIEKHIQPDSSAIVPVHVFGNACEIERIESIANRYNLKVIYDAAHAFGVRNEIGSLLKWGDISTISFHSTKLFHSIEGGAIITNDDKLADKVRCRANFGISGQYETSEIGINAKMNEFQAAMGLCVLDEIDIINKERVQIWEYYSAELDGLVQFQKMNLFFSRNNSYFPVLFETEVQMKKVLEDLNKNEIFPRRYFYPSLDTLPYLSNVQSMPVSRSIASRILCLPIFPGLDEASVAKITYIIRRILT